MPRLLTIAIPTFNRPEYLRQTLLALRPQACEEVDLIVVDNASNPPVQAVVDEVMAGSAWAFGVVRNPVNVGLCANILRCFEAAQGDWLWVLSDDDDVKPDAVTTILGTLDRHPDLLFATYSVPALPIEKEVFYESVDSFFLSLDSFPRVIFISAALYQRRELVRNLFLAYNFVDTGAPHTALLLLWGLSPKKSRLACLPQEIVTWQPPAAGERYSQFAVIGLHKLLTLCHGAVRQHLAALLRKAAPSPLRLLAHLARDAGRGRKRPVLKGSLDQYLTTYADLVGGPMALLWKGPLRLAFQLLLCFPALTLRVLNAAAMMLRGKELSLDPANVSLNSYERVSDTAGGNA